MKYCCSLLLCLLLTPALFAQPLDDIAERRIVEEKRLLPFEPVRETDLFWECRLGRVIDTRQKSNLVFRYPERPFFDLLREAALAGRITLYDPADEHFSSTIAPADVPRLFSQMDTVEIIRAETYSSEIAIVANDIYFEDIKKFRIQEIWYFDSRTSSLHVRILGIAPLQEVYDDNGNFLFEKPLFWAYYPELRAELSRHTVYMPQNERARITWEDLFEMRRFESYVYRAPDQLGRRLQDIYQGPELLREAEKVEAGVFTYEHDLWSY